MLEVHSYTPSTFNLLIDGDASWGKMAYYWGAGNHSTIEPDRNATFGEEDALIAEYGKMKKFVDKGIPVILGEYASWRRTAATGKRVSSYGSGYAQQVCRLLGNFCDQNYESEWPYAILVGDRFYFRQKK
jgi:hypothetical protein